MAEWEEVDLGYLVDRLNYQIIDDAEEAVWYLIRVCAELGVESQCWSFLEDTLFRELRAYIEDFFRERLEGVRKVCFDREEPDCDLLIESAPGSITGLKPGRTYIRRS